LTIHDGDKNMVKHLDNIPREGFIKESLAEYSTYKGVRAIPTLEDFKVFLRRRRKVPNGLKKQPTILERRKIFSANKGGGTPQQKIHQINEYLF